MDTLFNNVENAISQYERACEQEGILYDMIHDAENDLNRYSVQASSLSDNGDISVQRDALEQMKAAAQRLQQYQNQLQQVQNSKTQALRYLQATRSELVNVVKSIEQKLPTFDQSISAFEQMSSNSFGTSATAQLPGLRAKREEYKKNLNDAYALIERIDSALNDGGSQPQHVLRRR